MIRGLLFLVVVAFAVLAVTGVIEVKVHSDQLAQVPGRLGSVLKNGQLLEKTRTQLIRLKRAGEQKIIDDPTRRFELALLYAKADADRLEKLLNEKKENPAQLLPQAQLLADSVKRVQEQANHVSAETLVEFKEKSNEIFEKARGVLITLKGLQAQYEEAKNKLENVTNSLQDQIGGSSATSTPSPAGSVQPTPQSSEIPLNF